MKPITMGVIAGTLAAVTLGGGAIAQNPYADDIACRQYADQQTAGLRAQASQAGADAVGGWTRESGAALCGADDWIDGCVAACG